MTTRSMSTTAGDSGRSFRRAGWIALVTGILGAALVLFVVLVVLGQNSCHDLRDASPICDGPYRAALSNVSGTLIFALQTLGIASALVLALISVSRSERGAQWRSIGLVIVATLVGAVLIAVDITVVDADVGLRGAGFYSVPLTVLSLITVSALWVIVAQFKNRA
jgi:hypothetical protein